MINLNSEHNPIINEEHIRMAMQRIKDTALGPNLILMRCLKNKHVTKILALIYSKIHNDNIVPKLFRIARTLLIDKGNNPNDTSNWRPISVRSLLRRIFEKVS